MKDLILILAVTFLQIGVSFSHIALTYPLPRRVNYDFLDNLRTAAPCGGQAKGEPLSEFREGDNITVTWHLGYPHRGGYRIELLDTNDNVGTAQQLLPTAGGIQFTGSDDTTATSATVKLPSGFTCDNCTLRLVRQALEWGANYLFWSCSDIKIINTVSTFCSNKGTYSNGRCECERLYYGNRCQYWDECEADVDCSNGGKCYDTHAVSSPRKQCFCARGFFGEGCRKVSSVKSLNGLNLSEHSKNKLSDEYTLYYKPISDDEIEMVVEVTTTTWVGIGWKPTGPVSCRGLDTGPTSDGKPTSEPENTPEPESESNPEPESESTAEPESESSKPEYGSTAEAEATSEPEVTGRSGTILISTDRDYLTSQGLDHSFARYSCTPSSGSRPVAEISAEPESEGTAEPESEGNAEPESEGTAEPESEGTAEPESEGTAEPESEGTAEPESEGTAEPESKGMAEPESENTAEPESGSEPEAESIGGSNNGHPMDCTDMVVMAAKGPYSRIHDAFSRDRSTPKFDTYFGAGNSLTAAIGEERNGVTKILFRRKLAAADNRDHEITDALMNVIWAYGQEHLNYNHAPKTGLEFCTAKDIFFYRNDVLMYHGQQGKRGAASINFLTDSKPKGNRFERDPNTYATWAYNSTAKVVVFNLTASLQNGEWVALGISDDKRMAKTDVIHIGISSQGTPVHSDRYASGYTLPARDAISDENITSTWENGVLRAEIRRPVQTGNVTAEDDISIDECRHLILATGSGFGGEFFSKHENTPIISEEKLCFQSSSIGASSSLILVLLAATFHLLLM